MECNMCEHPWPYLCDECRNAILEEEEVEIQERIYIGSGEDVILDYVEQS